MGVAHIKKYITPKIIFDVFAGWKNTVLCGKSGGKIEEKKWLIYLVIPKDGGLKQDS